MDQLWAMVLAAGSVLAGIELILLERARRALTESVPVSFASAAARTQSPPALAGEVALYITADGTCALADPILRAWLPDTEVRCRLADVLSGGITEAAALLETLAREGLVDAYVTTIGTAPPVPVEIRAVAVRDRHGNPWGAAVFIRPTDGQVRDPAAAPSPS